MGSATCRARARVNVSARVNEEHSRASSMSQKIYGNAGRFLRVRFVVDVACCVRHAQLSRSSIHTEHLRNEYPHRVQHDARNDMSIATKPITRYDVVIILFCFVPFGLYVYLL